VLISIRNIFPEFDTKEVFNHPKLGETKEQLIKDSNVSMKHFLHLLHRQQILDTALDSMSRNIKDNTTEFQILRQSALSGKISFNIPNERPLGGLITIKLSGESLNDWVEAATWHKGRDTMPRSVNDERAMDKSGEATTWI
jgi:predicted RNA binding protein with dsRBD fold (UPF0201 family)